MRYFLETNRFKEELNTDNPLGTGGELTVAFANLALEMWGEAARVIAPAKFKSKLSRFAPQFNGFRQHDSQVRRVWWCVVMCVWWCVGGCGWVRVLGNNLGNNLTC